MSAFNVDLVDVISSSQGAVCRSPDGGWTTIQEVDPAAGLSHLVLKQRSGDLPEVLQ